MVKTLGAVALLSLAALAQAHGEQRRNLHARQNPPAAPSASGGVPVSASGGASAPAVSGSAPAAGSASSGRPSLTVTLAATNPTAVPLPSISGDASSRVPPTLASTVAPGTVPTVVAGAPALPREPIVPGNYPTPDAIPPIDSAEVDQWYDEVKNSGIVIPAHTPTKAGGCTNPENKAFIGDPERCWWTCGGCVTADDITECDTKNHWGLTFDDGPGFYTPNLLNYLDEAKLKATFFVVGSRVANFHETLRTEYAGGHQIAVHTWSHKALTTLSDREIVAELGWTKKIIKDVLGVTPNMMRPPFGDIDNRVRAISLAMGMTPVMWTRTSDGRAFNTQDFDMRAPNFFSVEKVLNDWQSLLDQENPKLDKGFITLQHDLYQEFVDLATGYIIPDGIASSLTIEPVSTCVKKRLADAYIETNDNSTYPPKAKLGVGSPGGPAGGAGAGSMVTPASIAACFIGGAGLLAGLLF